MGSAFRSFLLSAAFLTTIYYGEKALMADPSKGLTKNKSSASLRVSSWSIELPAMDKSEGDLYDQSMDKAQLVGATSATSRLMIQRSSTTSSAWPLFTPRRERDLDHKHVLIRFIKSAKRINLSPSGKNKYIPLVGSSDRVLNEEKGDGEHSAAEELSVEVLYEDLYDVMIFLFAAWSMGHIFMLLGMPALVGEIITGFMLGPPLADFVPFPEAMVLIGEIGLVGLLLEAGIEVDVAQLKETGARCFAMAVTGSVLPLLVGLGITQSDGYAFRAAIGAGACFSPTSLGVASNSLATGKVLNTPVGQLIVATCVIDDIIGLILLSVLEVLVDENAATIDYIIPFLSSFGYLIVLGYSAITWMPRVIELKILPILPEESRDAAVFGMMILLLFAYLPLLNYSRSSYLTGAFLAGLTFSQIHSIHATFVGNTRQLLNWLLRIFFASAIGFQVPIKNFADKTVIAHGFFLYLAVLAKLPLGLFVPHFNSKIPDGFPFDPYKRDAILTAVAMTCRGEFSFVIASFAIGENLFDATLYSSIVFAVLLSAVTSPFVLLQLIQYYNNQSEAFLLSGHEIAKDESTAGDGEMPLYLVIQMKSPNLWSLQERITRVLSDAGLSIIDHRSWHPRGLDAQVVTEVYAQDTKTSTLIPGAYDETKKDIQKVLSEEKIEAGTTRSVDNLEKVEEDEKLDDGLGSWVLKEEKTKVLTRCNEIRKELLDLVPADKEASIQVSQWIPMAISGIADQAKDGTHEPKPRFNLLALTDEEKEKLQAEVTRELDNHEVIGSAHPAGESLPVAATSARRRRNRKKSMSTPMSNDPDLWATDQSADVLAGQGVFPAPATVDISPGPRRRMRMVSDLGMLLEEAPTVEERLEGVVRVTTDVQEQRIREVGTRRRRKKTNSVPFLDFWDTFREHSSRNQDRAEPLTVGRTKSKSTPSNGNVFDPNNNNNA